MICYVNGKFVPESQAKISVYDHGFLYGDGVFEGIRVYNGRIFRCDDHVERLFDSAKMINLQIPMSKEEYKELLIKAVRRNGLREAYLRAVISRGVGTRLVSTEPGLKPTVVVIVHPDPLVLKRETASAIVSSVRRIPLVCLPTTAKLTHYINNLLAGMEARRAGATEAIMCDLNGNVVEMTGANIFIVKNGVLITPPLASGLLPGVTRRVVIEIADELGIPVQERNIVVPELLLAEEIFTTATRSEIIALVEVDGKPIGEGGVGPITLKIKEKFEEKKQDPSQGTPVYEKY